MRRVKTHTANGDEEYSYMLYILDENYNLKQEYKFNQFLEETNILGDVKIAIKNNNIVVSNQDDSEVFACDDRGSLKYKFKRELGHYLQRLNISNKNELLLPSRNSWEVPVHWAVHIYSKDGNLKSTIELPKGHRIERAAFHFVLGKIIVMSYVWKHDFFFLLCDTEEGELETRGETRALIGGGGEYSYLLVLPDEFLLKSAAIKVNFKRNSSGRTRIFTPPPQLTL